MKLYEFGKTYKKLGEDQFQEDKHLSVFLTGSRLSESWITPTQKSTYYTLKGVVQNMMRRLNVQKYQVSETQNSELAYGMKFHRGKQVLVEFGRVDSTILRKMDIKQEVFYADFHWDNLMKALSKSSITVEDLSKYPFTRRDLALIVDKSTKFSDIAAIAQKQAKQLLKNINLFDVYEHDEHIGKGKKSYAVSFILQDPTGTLKDKAG